MRGSSRGEKNLFGFTCRLANRLNLTRIARIESQSVEPESPRPRRTNGAARMDRLHSLNLRRPRASLHVRLISYHIHRALSNATGETSKKSGVSGCRAHTRHLRWPAPGRRSGLLRCSQPTCCDNSPSARRHFAQVQLLRRSPSSAPRTNDSRLVSPDRRSSRGCEGPHVGDRRY